MKYKLFKVSGLAVVIAALLGCPLPTTPGTDGSGGSLTIQVGNHINSQTLLPPISMTATSYTVSGTGPGGATFSQTTTGGSVTVDHLAFGSWNITVDAMNAEGTRIGSGNAAASVHTGQTTLVAISVVPLTGNGTLNLTVSWTASQVEIPSIVASLTPPVGAATPLSFSINGSQGTCSSTTIPAGYQTLTVQLMDNGIAVMGAVEVVRIVAGQTTSGTYAFTNVNQPGGSVVVNISPELADPIPVSISGVPATMTVGTSITATASVSDGTTGVVYVWYLNGVSVGTGESFTFGSALAAGYYRLDVTAYTTTRAGSATANFQVTGTGGSAVRFVYVANFGSNTVSAYSTRSDGELASLSTSIFPAGTQPYEIEVTPNRSFLYVANFGSGTLSAFAIGPDGRLTPLGIPTFETGNAPYEIAITPNGAFLYVGCVYGNNISAYAIGSGGLLTPLSTPTFDTGGGPVSVAVTPNGSFLYASNLFGGTVSAYAIGPDGLLVPLGTPDFAAGVGAYQIAITPNGSFLYVTNVNEDVVLAFAIGADGVLTPLGTPSLATGSGPYRLAVTPNGHFLYVTNYSADTVSAYAIGSDGILSPLSTPTYATGSMPRGIAVSSDGSFLYVTSMGNSTVSGYAIGADGRLTALASPAVPSGSNPMGIAVVPSR